VRRQLVVGEVDLFEPPLGRGADRPRVAGDQQPLGFGRHLPAVLLGERHAGPRLRVGVGPAADRDESDGSRLVLLDLLGRVPGPVGAALVRLRPEGGAVARVVQQHGPDLPVRALRDEHRQLVVDRPALPPAVGREPGLPAGDAERARLQVGDGGQRDRRQPVGQQPGVPVDPLLVVRRHRPAEQVRQHPADQRGRVRVRAGEHEPLRRHADLFPDPFSHLVSQGGGDAGSVDRDQHRHVLAVGVPDGQRPCVQLRLDTFGLGPAGRVPAEPDGEVGRDVDLGRPDRQAGVGRERRCPANGEDEQAE
jgi:hypothetical protein